jgi:hypothetical protein
MEIPNMPGDAVAALDGSGVKKSQLTAESGEKSAY